MVMEKVLDIRRMACWARFLDILMVPIMYLVSGTLREKPQRTHMWNVQSLTPEEFWRLGSHGVVECKGIKGVMPLHHWWNYILFHVPVLGGWRDYVILIPDRWQRWHIGWATPDGKVVQVSMLSQLGPVRVLIGPGDISFFGIDAEGHHISIEKIGGGRIGGGGPYRKVPLS